MSSETNALNLLSAYGTDTDSEDEISGAKVSVKRCFSEDNRSKKCLKQSEGIKLPVPSMLHTASESNDIQNEVHGGRIRSYPHERGNWSTYVYVPYEYNDIMTELIQEVMSKYKKLMILQPSDHLHISLTRTVVLRHHWIQSFVKSITEKINHIPRFIVMFDKLKVYCNDERTRTFIGLQIRTGHDSLLNIIQVLNQCLKDYNLPEFYKDPSFHMSLVWCVGDYEDILNNHIGELNNIVIDYMKNYPELYWYIHVKNIVCKTGNKIFQFNLPTVL